MKSLTLIMIIVIFTISTYADNKRSAHLNLHTTYALGYYHLSRFDTIPTTQNALSAQITFEATLLPSVYFNVSLLGLYRFMHKYNYMHNPKQFLVVPLLYYAQIKRKNWSLDAGKQQLQTPLLNCDDAQILPHTFDALRLKGSLNRHLNLEVAYIYNTNQKSKRAADIFQKSNKVFFTSMGLRYDNTRSKLWWYRFASHSIFYGSLSQQFFVKRSLLLFIGAQQTRSKNPTFAASNWGLQLRLKNPKALYEIYLAYNHNNAINQQKPLIGADPLFTSMEQTTLYNSAFNRAWAAGIAKTIPHYQSSIGYMQGVFCSDNKNKCVKEHNFTINHTLSNSSMVKMVISQKSSDMIVRFVLRKTFN